MTDIARLSIAVLTLLMFGGFAAYIVIKGASEATVQLLAGALIAWAGTAINYYVGSSQSSSAKDKTISDLTKEQPR